VVERLTPALVRFGVTGATAGRGLTTPLNPMVPKDGEASGAGAAKGAVTAVGAVARTLVIGVAAEAGMAMEAIMAPAKRIAAEALVAGRTEYEISENRELRLSWPGARRSPRS